MGAKSPEADSGVLKPWSLDPERMYSLAYSPQVKEKWITFPISPILDVLYLNEINIELLRAEVRT